MVRVTRTSKKHFNHNLRTNGLLMSHPLPTSLLPALTSHACSFTQLCLTLFNSMDCNPPGSSVHGIFQARMLECVTVSNSRGSSLSKDRTCISCISCIGRWILSHCTTWEALPALASTSLLPVAQDIGAILNSSLSYFSLTCPQIISALLAQ